MKCAAKEVPRKIEKLYLIIRKIKVNKMYSKLILTYWSLLSITVLSSGCLFFVVANENFKTVSIENTESDVDTKTEVHRMPLNADSAAQKSILPNFKKLKKPSTLRVLTDETGGDIRPADEALFSQQPISSGEQSEIVDTLPNRNIEKTNIDEVGDMAQFEIEKKKTLQPALATEQQSALSAEKLNETESLPDITEIPTVRVTELPLELLQYPVPVSIESIVIDTSKESYTQNRENKTMESLEKIDGALQKEEEIVKIDDSGGEHIAVHKPNENETHNTDNNIHNEKNMTDSTMQSTADDEQKNASSKAGTGDASSLANNVNLTVEEVPIPVFSEWAQKQMEAAEKQEAMEQEVVNTSAQKKNLTNGSGKVPPLKIRAKNYASPDCGAKIISSNADATSTGAVLSSSKDEYMLSPCGNRIWFVVELCEAIQAQKIDLANFELFSSSPKNFTVAVSNRFPTRDWSNVGRFIAEDKRNVQSFDLHPHLFGKFVRVDIHSHYSKEHFCPVSLFRVFGTSEFEAFETENRPNDDMDDFDDEFPLEQPHAKNSESNLFKSASDAVMSMVKKAAEVLVKPTNTSPNRTVLTQIKTHICRSSVFGQFSCADCNRSLVERINNALSCDFKQLKSLLNIRRLRSDLLNTQVCAKLYGFEAKTLQEDDCNAANLLQFEMPIKQSYFLNLLPAEYVGALCQLLTEQLQIVKSLNNTSSTTSSDNQKITRDADLSLNLTIDKQVSIEDLKIVNSKDGKKEPTLTSTEKAFENYESRLKQKTDTTKIVQTPTERNMEDDMQLARPPVAESRTESNIAASTTTSAHQEITPTTLEPAPDVNIFNVPDGELEQHVITEPTTTESISTESNNVDTITPITNTESTTISNALPKTEDDPNSWESLDNFLTSTVATVVLANSGGGVATAGAAVNGVNLQQKIPQGGGPQSESVFIRLSNRIKALERNMSLSGQYLEELSRRYKKQVEELQLTLTQQTQVMRTLEEHQRRHIELEQIYAQRNIQLKDELDELTLQVHACIAVIIFVGAFIFLVLMIGILFYRTIRRDTKEVLSLKKAVIANNTKRNKLINGSATANHKKLNRRKSFDDFSDHTINGECKNNSDKQRRPSEEAMRILKECGDSANVVDKNASTEKKGATRQRKISIFSASNNNVDMHSGGTNKNNKRKGEKHSWPTTVQQIQNQQSWQLNPAEADDEITAADNFTHGSIREAKNIKKKIENLKRQESAPGKFLTTDSPRINANIVASVQPETTASDYEDGDANLHLDEDDLYNFLPNTDLAYNEFMPEGPSGYQIVTAAKKNSADEKKPQTKKTRRLSSPAFFKSPFSKGLLKGKSESFNASASTSSSFKAKEPHESTSWEWYRLRRNEAQKQQQQEQQSHLQTSVSDNSGIRSALHRASPTASFDSSSLSEINFNTNSMGNSFRILEEAILSSGELAGGKTTAINPVLLNLNGSGQNSHRCGSQSSQSGGSSTTNSNGSTKKKSRSFNKIFRKVF